MDSVHDMIDTPEDPSPRLQSDDVYRIDYLQPQRARSTPYNRPADCRFMLP